MKTMGIFEVFIIIISLLMLYQGYRLGEKRSVGGIGGFLIVLLFSVFGLAFVYFSPNKNDPDQVENAKNFREALVFIGLLILFLVLFVIVVYNVQH